MAIEFDASRLSSAAANLAEADVQTASSTLNKLAPLFSGSSLSVSDGALSDLEALVARLKNENEKTKFSLLLTSLGTINESLTAAQKEAIEEGLKLSEKLDTLNKELDGLSGTEAEAKAAVLVIQMKIESLEKQIEQARKDGKEHNDLVRELKAARQELDAKNDQISRTQGRISEVKNEISAVKGKIAAVVNSIGENTLKTIANEIAGIAKPEKAESSAEKDKAARKEESLDPFNSIRESLDRIGRELADTIEKNTEVMV